MNVLLLLVLSRLEQSFQIVRGLEVHLSSVSLPLYRWAHKLWGSADAPWGCKHDAAGCGRPLHRMIKVRTMSERYLSHSDFHIKRLQIGFHCTSRQWGFVEPWQPLAQWPHWNLDETWLLGCWSRWATDPPNFAVCSVSLDQSRAQSFFDWKTCHVGGKSEEFLFAQEGSAANDHEVLTISWDPHLWAQRLLPASSNCRAIFSWCIILNRNAIGNC